MMRLLPIWLSLALSLSGLYTGAQVQKVGVGKNSSGQWELIRNGEPYYVKGAGGHVHLDKLVEIGGNSIRTWSTDNAIEILDAAHEKGLTVMMGLWVQHERHGFDYNDADKVAAQLEGFRKVVTELKDHPALLMWGVGNEVDLFYTNTKVWFAVNDIAKMIHEVDPNHPTCTVTAGLDKEEVRLIKERAPEIDIYGVNTYGDLGNVKDNIRAWGWTGPYMITEWGPNGHWEVQKTKWGAPVEQSSTEKANSYEERYTRYIDADREMCLGSYVFLWGQKQETTSTWYGLFSEKGESCEAIDRLYQIWNGKAPENMCPAIDSLRINGQKKGQHITMESESPFEALAAVRDRDNDVLKYRWLIIPESTDIKAGGDAETAPLPIAGSVTKKKKGTATLRAPQKEGAYRLFLFITDGHDHYAYENVPFYVVARPPGSERPRAIGFKKLTLAEE